MVATIIEIDIPQHKVASVQAYIKSCVQKTGDFLIGYSDFSDGSKQLIVKLTHNDYIPKHQIVLGPALQAGAIYSFTFKTCVLTKLVFDDESTMKRLATFPFREKECWFPAIDNPKEAYLCLMAQELSKEQSEWVFALSQLAQEGLSTEGVPPDLL